MLNLIYVLIGVRTDTTQDTDLGLMSRKERPKRLVQPNRKYLEPDWVA
jgi:hypothetical protein